MVWKFSQKWTSERICKRSRTNGVGVVARNMISFCGWFCCMGSTHANDMKNGTLQHVVHELETLPESLQLEVLEFIQQLKSPSLQGKPGQLLLQYHHRCARYGTFTVGDSRAVAESPVGYQEIHSTGGVCPTTTFHPLPLDLRQFSANLLFPWRCEFSYPPRRCCLSSRLTRPM